MKIYIKESVYKDLCGITKNKAKQREIIDKIVKLMEEGKYEKLKGHLKQYYRVRVGKYRAIFCEYKEGLLILRIAKREDIYKKR